MPFDDLTPQQQQFIRAHFKAAAKIGSSSKKYNALLIEKATPVYEKINELKLKIGGLKLAYLETNWSSYESWLDNITAKFEKRIDDNKKHKKGDVKFDDLLNELRDLDGSLDLHEQRTLNEIEMEKHARTMQGKKEEAARDALNRIKPAYTETEILASKAIARMRAATAEDIRMRDALILQAKQKTEVARTALLDKLQTGVSVASETAEAFATACDQIATKFEQDMKKVQDGIARLVERSIPTVESSMRLMEENAGLPTAAREKDRMILLTGGDGSEGEIRKLEKAIALQETKLTELEEAFKNAKGKAKDEMRPEHKKLVAHLETLRTRLEQYKGYAEDYPQRTLLFAQNLMIERNLGQDNINIAKALNGEGGEGKIAWLEARIEAQDPLKFNAMVMRDDQIIIDNVAAQRRRFIAASKREVGADTVFPGETPLTDISDTQLALLEGMLDNALLCVEKGQYEYAALLRTDADRLFTDFMMERRRGLPLPDANPSLPTHARFYTVLDGIETKLRDLWARGNGEAEGRLKDVTALRREVEDTRADLAKNGLVDAPGGYDAVDGKITRLRDEVERMTAPPESERARLAKESASKKADEVYAKLRELYKTKKITDPSKVEVPGKSYTAKEREGLIPADNVIVLVNAKGEEELHQIRTKVGKGAQELHRREDKHVPREMMDFMKQRADTLKMMASSGAVGCENMMQTYQEETDRLLQDLVNGGAAKFDEVQKLIDGREKAFASDPLKSYLPMDFGTVKTAFDKFKTSYTKMAPTDALTAAREHHTAVDKLVIRAGEIKEDYKEGTALAGNIFFDLNGIMDQNGLAEGSEIGTKMHQVIDGQAGTLLNAIAQHIQEMTQKIRVIDSVAVPTDEQIEEKSKATLMRQRLGLAQQQIRAAQEWYTKQSKEKFAMPGKYQSRLDAAKRKLETRHEANVTAALAELKTLKQEIDSLYNSIKPSVPTGPDNISYILSMAETMGDMAVSESKEREDKVIFLAEAKTLKTNLDAVSKALDKKGKSSVSQELKNQYKGHKARYAALLKGTGPGKATYEDSLAQLRSLEADVLGLADTVNAVGIVKTEDVKAIPVSNKVDALETFVGKLKEYMTGLTTGAIEKVMSEDEKNTYQVQLTRINSSLGQIAKVPDMVANLRSIGTRIDDAIKLKQTNSDAPSSKAERIRLREEGLAELRRVRSILEVHPSVQLYRDNPFNMGRGVSLLGSACHQVEIALLACVSPKES